MRINVCNRTLPGVQSERIPPTGPEMYRERVYCGQTHIGDVVYEARRGRDRTEYGWRPAGPGRHRLRSKREAIARLPQYRTVS